VTTGGLPARVAILLVDDKRSKELIERFRARLRWSEMTKKAVRQLLV